jgi:hypothetical protein
MRKSFLILAIVAGLPFLPETAFTQETNAYLILPQTRLEGFETNTGTVIIRATAPIGTVAANSGELAIKCKDATDAGSGHRESGIAVEINGNGRREDILLVDYDELDPLLNAIDYLSRLDWSVTTFPGFDAIYTTKGGLRLVAFGGRRSGAIEFAVRSLRANWPPLLFSRDQLGQLRSLVEQAKAKLDSLRKEK